MILPTKKWIRIIERMLGIDRGANLSYSAWRADQERAMHAALAPHAGAKLSGLLPRVPCYGYCPCCIGAPWKMPTGEHRT